MDAVLEFEKKDCALLKEKSRRARPRSEKKKKKMHELKAVLSFSSGVPPGN